MIALIDIEPVKLSGFKIIAQKPVCFAPGDGSCEGIVVMGYRKDTDEWGIWTWRGEFTVGEYFFDWPAALRRFNERDY
jgi:hypothetical protein